MTTTAQTSSPEKVSPWQAARIVAISALLLVPCFWQSRIQAGDLSSHVYNAWLASLIAQGKVHGLWIASRSNNVLFDLALAWLLPHVGAGAAQRVAVSATVLIFAWGAIALMFRAGGKNWWFVVPSVAMLTYGFTYHMGFFNFQLSLGICLCYLATFWTANWRVRLLLTPLLALAWLAHPFPVIWALGTAMYFAVAQRVRPQARLALLGLGVVVIIFVRYWLAHHYRSVWSAVQIFSITGATQLLVFDRKYLFVMVGLLLVWLTLLGNLGRERGIAALVRDSVFQLWMLNAAAVLLLPSRIMFPNYALPFSFVSDRVALLAGIVLGGVVAAMPMRVHERIVLLATAAAFFLFLFLDTRDLNREEDRVGVAIAQLPAGSRVLGFFPPPLARVNGLLHVVDRACVFHCFSYADYEPVSRQFRIRAGPGNGVVLDDYHDIALVEDGKYVVQPRDLPVYGVYSCGPQGQNVCSRPLRAGEVNGELGEK